MAIKKIPLSFNKGDMIKFRYSRKGAPEKWHLRQVREVAVSPAGRRKAYVLMDGLWMGLSAKHIARWISV